MTVAELRAVLSLTYSAWNDHEATRLGAALAFYTILSLAPLVMMTVAVVAMALGHSSAQEQIVAQVRSMVGDGGAHAVQNLMAQAQKPASGILASAIGLLTLLFGASGVFGELRSALNKMWDVKPVKGGGLMGMLKERFFSFGMVLAIGFLLLVSLVLSAGLAALGKFSGQFLPIPEAVMSVIDFLISLGAISLLFALIFKFVPETKVAFKEVWAGAVATALLFVIGKFLIGLYLGKAGVGSAYGAAGSLIVIIVWVYYSAQIFFFGAELTHVLAARQRGSH